MSHKEADLLGEMSDALDRAHIRHGCYHDCIHVGLSNDFDILEVKAWPDGDHSVQLLEGDFHTHVELLAQEYGLQPVEAVVTLVQKILRSELLLIEERSPEGRLRKTINSSLEEYLKYLPAGSTYRVVNET